MLQAKLVLSRDDLHAVEETLLVQQGDDVRAYRISETSFERRPQSAVAPAVFEPEPELLSEMIRDESTKTKDTARSTTVIQPATPVVATAALEVEVLQLLNQANAFMGEQLSVTHTPEGKLLVSGLVETTERKAELLRALSTVRDNSAVRIEIETVAEALNREGPKSSGPKNSGSVTVNRVEATEGTSAAYSDLKQKFSDDEARRFADRVMSRSRQARRHALALKQLAERFSLSDLQTLSESDHARWISLLREHAREFQRETEELSRELRQVFPAQAGEPASGSTIVGDAEIQETVRRLYELSVAFDESVRKSFALSAEASAVAPVKSSEFWRALRDSEGLAANIAKSQ